MTLNQVIYRKLLFPVNLQIRGKLNVDIAYVHKWGQSREYPFRKKYNCSDFTYFVTYHTQKER